MSARASASAAVSAVVALRTACLIRSSSAALSLVLVRLDAREFNYFSPLLGFVGDELAEVGGRPWKHCAANVGKPRFHLGIGEEGVS